MNNHYEYESYMISSLLGCRFLSHITQIYFVIRLFACIPSGKFSPENRRDSMSQNREKFSGHLNVPTPPTPHNTPNYGPIISLLLGFINNLNILPGVLFPKILQITRIAKSQLPHPPKYPKLRAPNIPPFGVYK